MNEFHSNLHIKKEGEQTNPWPEWMHGKLLELNYAFLNVLPSIVLALPLRWLSISTSPQTPPPNPTPIMRT